MVQKKAVNKKGGARNFKKPVVDIATLTAILEKHHTRMGVPQCFDFKAYHKKPRSYAVHAMSLLHMKPLLLDFLKVSPTGALSFTSLKQAFSVVLEKESAILEVNLKKSKGGAGMADVVCDLADGLLCALTHTRRLKDDVRWTQAVAKLDAGLVRELETLRDAVTVLPGFVEECPATQDLMDEIDDAMPDANDEEADLPKTQDLIDECGSDVGSLLEEAFTTSPIPTKKKDIEEKIETMKKPAATVVVMKKPAMVGGATSSEPSGVHSYESHAFGHLYITCATAQSYIQYKDGDKKVLLAAISKNKVADHAATCILLAKWICKQSGSLTKDAVIAKRNSMFD